jgi:methyl-accepting chemotaxis protein
MTRSDLQGARGDDSQVSFRHSLKGRLITLFLALSLAPLAIVGTLTFLQSQQTLQEATYSDLDRSSQVQSAILEQWLNQRIADMQLLATTEEIQTMQPERVNPYLKTMLEQYKPIYESLVVGSPDGVTHINMNTDGKDIPLAERDYYKLAMQGKANITDVMMSKGTGNMIMTIAAPIKSGGKIVGTVSGNMPMKTISTVLDTGRVGKTGEIYLVNKSGFMMTPSRFTDQLKVQGLIKERSELEMKVDSAGFKEAIAGKSGIGEYRGYRGKDVLGAYRPVKALDVQMAMLAEVDRDEAFAPTTQLRSVVLACGLIAAILIAVVAILLARGIANPMVVIADAARDMGKGGLADHISVEQWSRVTRRRDEIGQLGSAFQQMREGFTSMAQAAQRIAGGDLTVEVQPRSDRDLLGIAFQNMSAGLRSLVGEVKSSADSLAENSEQLGTAAGETGAAVQQVTVTIQHVARGAQEQSEVVLDTNESMERLSESITQVAAGAEQQAGGIKSANTIAAQMSTQVQQVATNATQVVQTSRETREAALKGSKMVDETIQGIARLRDTVDRTATQIDALGQASEQIGAVVETIDDIAEQTNLLALNAAIEAARAGEHGRGFAVVADEVRKLAERSSRETRQIADLVRKVQNDTAAAVQAMHAGAQEAEVGSTLAGRAGEALGQIVTSVEATVAQVQDIAEAASQMATASREVTGSLGDVSAIVEQARTAAVQMEGLARKVSKAVQGAAATAEENSAATEEVSASAQEMSAQVEEMTAQAAELAKTAGQLRGMVERFRVDQSAAHSPQENVTPRRRTSDWEAQAQQRPLGARK